MHTFNIRHKLLVFFFTFFFSSLWVWRITLTPTHSCASLSIQCVSFNLPRILFAQQRKKQRAECWQCLCIAHFHDNILEWSIRIVQQKIEPSIRSQKPFNSRGTICNMKNEKNGIKVKHCLFFPPHEHTHTHAPHVIISMVYALLHWFNVHCTR